MTDLEFIYGVFLVLCGGIGIGAGIVWFVGKIDEMFDDKGGWK